MPANELVSCTRAHSLTGRWSRGREGRGRHDGQWRQAQKVISDSLMTGTFRRGGGQRLEAQLGPEPDRTRLTRKSCLRRRCRTETEGLACRCGQLESFGSSLEVGPPLPRHLDASVTPLAARDRLCVPRGERRAGRGWSGGSPVWSRDTEGEEALDSVVSAHGIGCHEA